MQWEVRELLNDLNTSLSKSGIIYSLWSRFEALIVMVKRADDVFGPIVIMCQGYLLTSIFSCVFYIASR